MWLLQYLIHLLISRCANLKLEGFSLCLLVNSAHDNYETDSAPTHTSTKEFAVIAPIFRIPNQNLPIFCILKVHRHRKSSVLVKCCQWKHMSLCWPDVKSTKGIESHELKKIHLTICQLSKKWIQWSTMTLIVYAKGGCWQHDTNGLLRRVGVCWMCAFERFNYCPSEFSYEMKSHDIYIYIYTWMYSGHLRTNSRVLEEPLWDYNTKYLIRCEFFFLVVSRRFRKAFAKSSGQ